MFLATERRLVMADSLNYLSGKTQGCADPAWRHSCTRFWWTRLRVGMFDARGFVGSMGPRRCDE